MSFKKCGEQIPGNGIPEECARQLGEVLFTCRAMFVEMFKTSVGSSARQDTGDWHATLGEGSMEIVAKQRGNRGGNLI